MSGDDWDVVVIGAGLGGLACATDLAHRGASVLVVEQQERAGGLAGSFRREGFDFELSLHLMDTYCWFPTTRHRHCSASCARQARTCRCARWLARLENGFFNIHREGRAAGLTPVELQLQWRLAGDDREWVGRAALRTKAASNAHSLVTPLSLIGLKTRRR